MIRKDDILKWKTPSKSLSESTSLYLVIDSTSEDEEPLMILYHDTTAEDDIVSGSVLSKVGEKDSIYGCTYFDLNNNDIKFMRTEDSTLGFIETESIILNEKDGIVNVIGEYQVNGLRVVSSRQTDPLDSTTQIIVNPEENPTDASTLRNDLVTNTIPSIQNNIDGVSQKVNDILSILRNHGLI